MKTNTVADGSISPEDLCVEPPWPAWKAALTCWWLPATTARRTQGLSLTSAYLIHLCALYLLLVSSRIWENQVPYFLLNDAFKEFWRTVERLPLSVSLALLGAVAVGVEAGFVGLALLLGPWGAADERVWGSIRNTVRQTWLHTAGVVPICALVALLAMPLEKLSETYDHEHQSLYESIPRPDFGSSPPVAPGRVQSIQEWTEYEKRVARAEMEWRARRSIVENHPNELLGALVVAAGLWLLWALMRAIGAERRITPIVRDPTCAACGYNLVATPMDGRCPECGRRARESLEPSSRPGAPWQRRRELGRLRAWWRTSIDAVLRPTQLGQQLWATQRATDHRWFLVVHAIVLAIIVDVIVIIGAPLVLRLAIRGFPDYEPLSRRDIEELAWNQAPVMATFGGGLMLATPLLVAGAVGWVLSWRAGRNLIPTAMQAAAYLGPLLAFLILISLVAGMVVLGVFMRVQLASMAAGGRFPVSRMLLRSFGWMAMDVLFLVGYGMLVERIAIQGRYANR